MASNPRRLMAAPERRAALLTAAAEAFAERGFAATSMDDVAAAAGITRLILYRHFDSKEALYDAVLAAVADRLAIEFAAALDDRAGLAAVQALLAVARADPSGYTLLWRHATREPRFAGHAEDFQSKAVGFARTLLSGVGLRGARLTWAAETAVSYAVSAVSHWVETQPQQRDGEFVALMRTSLPAMVNAWAQTPQALAEPNIRS